jgi:hypothetical protein
MVRQIMHVVSVLKPTASDPAAAARPNTDPRLVQAKAAFASALSDASSTELVHAASTVDGTRPGETVKAVAGHAYDQITSGARKGEFLNEASGNPRRGKAFTIERAPNGNALHVYGSGAHRLVVEIIPRLSAGGGSAAPTSLN